MGAITNFVLNLILIPIYASVGAAVGTLGAEIAVCSYQCIKICKDIPVRKYIFNVVPYIAISIFMYVFIKQMPAFFVGNLPNMIVKVTIGSILYIIILFVIFFIKSFYYRYGK